MKNALKISRCLLQGSPEEIEKRVALIEDEMESSTSEYEKVFSLCGILSYSVGKHPSHIGCIFSRKHFVQICYRIINGSFIPYSKMTLCLLRIWLSQYVR